jgi:hypothetical protein
MANLKMTWSYNDTCKIVTHQSSHVRNDELNSQNTGTKPGQLKWNDRYFAEIKTTQMKGKLMEQKIMLLEGNMQGGP